MMGTSCVKSWSKTQATIAQSSAESELIASVKGATEGLGIVSLGRDFGIELSIRLHLDAAAAFGILERKGVGRVRHLDVASLWLHEKELRNMIEMRKVPGLDNPPDVCTKHLTRDKFDHCCVLMDCEFVAGRAVTAADLHSVNEVGLQPAHWRMGRVERHDHEKHVLLESNASVGARCGHQEIKHWNWLSSTCLRGMFRNARAYRSPTCVGVDWSSVENRDSRCARWPSNARHISNKR